MRRAESIRPLLLWGSAALFLGGCVTPGAPNTDRLALRERVVLAEELVEIREADLEHIEAMFANGIASQSDVHDAQAAVVEAKLKLNQAEASLEAYDAR